MLACYHCDDAGVNSNLCGHFLVLKYPTEAAHRVSAHHFRIIDHSDEVDDGEGWIEHVGAEEVLVQGDPLAAQTPEWIEMAWLINMLTNQDIMW